MVVCFGPVWYVSGPIVPQRGVHWPPDTTVIYSHEPIGLRQGTIEELY